jgi:polar amino acid transport system substrate-binding protein
MKKIIALFLSLTLILSAAACGYAASDEEEIRTVSPGKLTVAFSPDFAPMEFVDLTKEGQDKYVGFDVTLAKFIAEYLRLQLVLVPMSFDSCQKAVADGTVDLSISGFSWSEQREQDYNLSDYYYATVNEDTQILITLASNGEKYADEEGLSGVRIGVQASSMQKDLTESQLPESEPVIFTNLEEAVERLMRGEFDCIAVAEGNADAIIANHPEIAKSGFRFTLTEKQKGNLILLQKGNDELTELVNNALSKAKMYYDTWYADARSTAGIETSYDDEGNLITD